MKRRFFLAAATLLSLFVGSTGYAGEDKRILVQSTTSTQNSGLYDYLIPLFEKETGFRVDVVAVGTGQAIKNAMNGDADVLFVHALQSELKFVEQGYGLERYDVMYNDFVLIGPKDDPAKIAALGTVNAALQAISDSGQTFVSRGDDSGTHKKELRLWKAARLTPAGNWYRETGSGMGATIRMAVEMDGYTLTDRATWIAYNAKNNHRILLSGPSELFNQYGVIALNPDKFPYVNKTGGQAFVNWLTGEQGQKAIAQFRAQGQQLFFPNAQKTASN
jgi:tungstate transport system substrate-binding protein